MDQHITDFGKVFIGDIDSMFEYTVEVLNETAKDGKIQVGLTGGSTPKAFYKWCNEKKPLSQETVLNTVWSVSDERFVPLESDDSNFGTADRLLLSGLGIAKDRKRAWPTEGEPEEAAEAFSKKWSEDVDADKGFDLCFLGMGDDCHTASIFPESPLIEAEIMNVFASVKVPEKGWRLTTTPYGLSKCGRIIITVTGEGKKEALKEVFKGEYNPLQRPIQLMQNFPKKVTWLIDPAAAGDTF